MGAGAWPFLVGRVICLLNTCQWAKNLPFTYVNMLSDSHPKQIVGRRLRVYILDCHWPTASLITSASLFATIWSIISCQQDVNEWSLIAMRLEAAQRAKDHIWRICVQLALITAELLESRSSGMKGRRNWATALCIQILWYLRNPWILLVQIVHWTAVVFKPCRKSNIVGWKVHFRGFVWFRAPDFSRGPPMKSWLRQRSGDPAVQRNPCSEQVMNMS